MKPTRRNAVQSDNSPQREEAGVGRLGWAARWIAHHKVSSWVGPEGADALTLQSATYTAQLLT